MSGPAEKLSGSLNPDTSGAAPEVLLEGGINFRDMGGLPATHDGRVKPRILFRSGALDRLTKADVALLEKWRARHVIDYRDPGEALARPSVPLPGVHSDLVSANPVSSASPEGASLRQMAAEVMRGGDPLAFMRALYAKLPFENPAYRHMMATALKLEDGGLVQHCMMGKDRTGVGAAILLLGLGVSREVILEDYLKTDAALAPIREQEARAFADEHGRDTEPGMAVLLSVRPEFLQAAFAAIDARFGGTDVYLREEFGLDVRRLEVLRQRYLH